MSAAPPNAVQLAIAAGLAIACAVGGVVGLAAFAKPADFEARVAAVERDTDQAARLLRHRRSGPLFPRGAVCSGDAEAAAARLKAELMALAAVSRLEHPTVQVTARPPAAGERLAALQVRLEASGPYDGALSAIDRLSAVRPVMFVDSVDLVSKTSYVTLAVSGRAYCSAPRSS